MEFNILIEAFVSPYAKRSRANRLHYLNRRRLWAEVHGIDPAAPTRVDLDRYRGHLLDEGGMPSAINTHLSILRMFSRWLVEEGHLKEDPAGRGSPPRKESHAEC